MKILTYILLFLLPCAAVATTPSDTLPTADKVTGDNYYIANDFDSAIALYEAVLASGKESHELYYNLGNAYYKKEEMGKAILNYERALLLAPGDKDTQFNLALAKSKTVDKVSEPYKIFFVEWKDALINMLTLSSWTTMAIAAFIVLLLSVLLFLWSDRVALRKSGFFVALFSLFVTLFANYAAWQHHDRLTNRETAIILQPSVTAKSTPDKSGTDLFVIHEGRKVRISDDTMKTWKEIELEDGTMGWVPASSLEVI